MFISIKKYLDSRPEQVASALLRMVQLLLQGIELHAVAGDAADHERFRKDIHLVQESLGGRPAAADVLVAAGTVVKAMEEYNQRTSRFIHVQCAELQTMVGMLTKAMTTLSTGSESSVTRLQTIERQLHKASMIEDFQTARLRLSECLDTFRVEIFRQREESTRAVSDMRTDLETSQKRVAPIVAAVASSRREDPVTGLPERAAAEAAIIEAAAQNRPVYAAMFVIDRLDLINARFGYAAGDQVLVVYTQHVAQGLSRQDKLFRWRGPALLALLERSSSPKQVREEIMRIAAQRLEKTIQVGTRSVLLPVGANWAIFSVAEYRPVQLLFQQLDLFVQGGGTNRVASELAGEA
jgi:GGDEF domain-containing protein